MLAGWWWMRAGWPQEAMVFWWAAGGCLSLANRASRAVVASGQQVAALDLQADCCMCLQADCCKCMQAADCTCLQAADCTCMQADCCSCLQADCTCLQRLLVNACRPGCWSAAGVYACRLQVRMLGCCGSTLDSRGNFRREPPTATASPPRPCSHLSQPQRHTVHTACAQACTHARERASARTAHSARCCAHRGRRA